MTKAAAFLSSIDASEDTSRQLNSPSSTNVKKSERPLTSVQQMILAKEQETKKNKAAQFTPRPDNKLINKDRKSVFVTQKLEPIQDKLSKSEINRMGVINTVMSNSPSSKNLNKLKNIQSILVPTNHNKTTTAPLKPSLPRTFSTKKINKQLTSPSSIAIKTWLDNDRDNIKLATFVCRMLEIKQWIENLLNISIGLNDSNIDQFPDYLTNGVLIAKIAQHFDHSINKIYNPDEYKMINKQFKYTENIMKFLVFTRSVKLPSLFIFETNDLYEKKDIPKVIACLHALSCLMSMLGKADPVVCLTDDQNISTVLSSSNINVECLKQIKHKIGRGTLGRKYVEGFEEAVRVNVGDDIKRLQLVQIEAKKQVKKEEKPEVAEKIEEIEETKEIKEEEINETNDNEFSFLTISDDNSLSDIDLDLDLTQPSTPENEPHIPPNSEEQETIRDARLLFNNPIPSMPSIHSLSAIEKKYRYLIDEEERELLGQSTIVKSISIKNLSISTLDPNTALIQFQSLARGFLLRYDLFVTKAILKGNTSSIISFQALCRGKLQRNKGKKLLKKEKSFNELDISNKMSKILREKHREMKMNENVNELNKNTNEIIQLQSHMKGFLLRNKYWNIRKSLLHEMNIIIRLQSLIRGLQTREFIINGKKPSSINNVKQKSKIKTIETIKKLNLNKSCSTTENPLQAPYDEDELFERFDIPRQKQEPYILPPPGHVPRRLVAKQENAHYTPNLPITSATTPPNTPPRQQNRSISRLQHSPTKVGLNKFIQEDDYQSDEENYPEIDEIYTPEITKLQSIGRGVLTRKRLNNMIDQIYDKEPIFSSFTAHIRGGLTRKAYFELRNNLKKTQNEIITIQSLLRAVEVQVDYDILKEDLDDERNSVIALQSIIRGCQTRKKIRERDEWFRKPENVRKICTLQAAIRGFHGVQDYKALIKKEDPPLRAVCKFISVLGKSDKSESGKEIVQLKKEISKEKGNVQKQIDKLRDLKVKVETLKKFGIDLKNVSGGLKSNVDNGTAVLRELVDVEIPELDDLKTSKHKDNTLDKCLGTFFYTLQSKPEYWSRVLNYIEMSDDIVEFSYGNIEDWILKCFGYNDVDEMSNIEPTKEEYLFMKLVVSTFTLFLNRLNEEDFKKMVKGRNEMGNIKYWELLLHAYLNLPQQRKFTKEILGDCVFLITSDDEINYECDPNVIFTKLVEDAVINNDDKINVEVGNIEPFDIDEVSAQYVQNMQNLRDISYLIIENIKKKIHEIPNFIKCLMKEFYETMNKQLNVSDDYIKSMVLSIFMKCYVLPIFVQPANYSIDVFAVSDDLSVVERVTRNLQLVSEVIEKCGSMRHFNNKTQKYLTSLNGFIDEIRDEMKDLVNEIINVSNLDVSYQREILISGEEFIRIQADDVIELIGIWQDFVEEIFIEEKINGGIMYYTLTEMRESDFGGISLKKRLEYDSYGYSKILIVKDSEEEMERIVIDTLKYEIKKYLTYILQVQNGQDLVEVLVSEMLPADELLFQQLVRDNEELSNISLPQAKKHTLEMIFELERRGIVDSNDGYATIVQSLANDIRERRAIEEAREKEKDIVVEIVTELRQRSTTLKRRYDEYCDSIRIELNSKIIQETPNDQEPLKRSFIKKLLKRQSKWKKDNSGKKLSVKSLVIHGVIVSGDGHITISCERGGWGSITVTKGTSIWKITLERLLELSGDGIVGVKSTLGLEFVVNAFIRSVLKWFYNV